MATHSGCIMDWAAQVKEGPIRQLLCRQHCAVPNEARPADKWQSQGLHTNRSHFSVLRDSLRFSELPFICIPDRWASGVLPKAVLFHVERQLRVDALAAVQVG